MQVKFFNFFGHSEEEYLTKNVVEDYKHVKKLTSHGLRDGDGFRGGRPNSPFTHLIMRYLLLYILYKMLYNI